MMYLLPKRLAGQLILLLLSMLVASQLITLFISLSETDNMLTRVQDNRILKMSASAVNTIEKIPVANHTEIAKLMTTYRVHYHFSDEPSIPTYLLKGDDGRVNMLKSLLNQPYEKVYIHQYPAPPNRIVTVSKYYLDYLLSFEYRNPQNADRPILFSTSIMLEQGRWFNMDLHYRKPLPSYALLALSSLLVVSLIASLIVVFSIKRITKPLKELTTKAQLLGVGEEIEPIIEQGPEDIKDTITAFNTMQLRLQNIITHRTRSLAAMSHDLRTPLTSLRLHAEFIDDVETQAHIVNKIDEMEQITKATISFAKQDQWSEKRKQVDLVALIDSLCQDLSDIGIAVECQLNDKISYSCRPIALRRVFSNLIENGVKYGKSVSVKILEEKEQIKITISDQGPGIEQTQQQRLFEPFERLDESRNHQSGGLGLGLTIALTIIRGHGGDITLHNGESRGLDVIVSLPIQ